MVFGKVKLVTQVNRRRTQSVAAKVLTPCNPVTSDGLGGGGGGGIPSCLSMSPGVRAL